MNTKSDTVKKAFTVAFPYTIPTLAGFMFLGISYGVYMSASGCSFLYPGAIFGLLVVYALRNTDILTGSHGLPEVIAIGIIIPVHVWRRNMFISIASGTISYMLLVQFVFKGFGICAIEIFIMYIKLQPR